MLRVHSTNEKAGYNPLTESDGQTRLSLPAMLSLTWDGNDQRKCALYILFPLEHFSFSVKVWCGGTEGNFQKNHCKGT